MRKKICRLKQYLKCPENHEPNEKTKKALEMAKTGNDLKKAATVEDLFKKLAI